MAVKYMTILFMIVMTRSLVYGQIYEDAEKVFRLSEETQKPILLVFSGSDWCAPCIKFHNNVLSQESFLSYAADHFFILKADFPQRKKLPAERKAQNEQLADQFNPAGQFPHIVLLNPDKKLIRTLFYKNQSAERFVEELSRQFAE